MRKIPEIETTVKLAFSSMLFVSIISGAQLSAATIAYVSSPLIGGNGSKVSVYAGKAAYGGSSQSQMGDGTVSAFRFFNDPDGDNTISTYVSGGGLIGDMTKSTNYASSRRDYLNLWTSTDPGALSGGVPAFDSAANFTSSTGFGFNNGTSGGAGGAIDISGLASGTVYFVHGTFNDGQTLALTMSGTGQTDLNASADVGGGSSNTNGVADNSFWVSSFSFDNTGGDYDTVAFDVAGTNGIFNGVVIDGVAIPEPSFAALLGLAGLALLLRRRV